ncbi:MAG: cytochrome P450 [Acidobacteriota bacterium]
MDTRPRRGPDTPRVGPAPECPPVDPDVAADPRAAYDAMRERCPVAHDGRAQWTVFRHADIVRVVGDASTFSNIVSRHPSVPNGMDPPEHTAYRCVIETYFSAERVAAFEPECRRLASALGGAVCRPPRGAPAASPVRVDVMRTLGLPFAAEAQCAYFGWPVALSIPLIEWAHRNHEATLARDQSETAAVATEFERLVDDLLHVRNGAGPAAPRDLTESLLRERVGGRPIDRAAIVSVLRNCTMGEVGTIAASVGIIARFLAERPDEQERLRRDPAGLPSAIDEILRLHGPLVDNRRVATGPTTIGERRIERDDRVVVNWVAANRDPRAFADADQYRPDRDPADNLLYGAGIHVCPGAPLARLELRVMTEVLLAATASMALLSDRPARHAVYPAGGYASLWLEITATRAR